MYLAQFGDSKYRPCPLIKEMVAAGRLGRKSGRGYYDHSGGRIEPQSTDAVLEAQLCQDLLLAYLGDAIDMNRSGYASREDIDAGMRLGCGLPFGPWEEIERRGFQAVADARRDLAARTGIAEFAPE